MSQKEAKANEFEAIINRCSRLINTHIQKFNFQEIGVDPNDIIQEVKLKLWKILNDEKKIKNYTSYINKIINSSVIDQIRKLKREEKIIIYEKHKSISEQKSNYRADIPPVNSIKEIIGQAVDSLMKSRRKPVKLFLLNMTLDEIAIYLNWSKDKTRNLLYRGLADLKRILK